MRCSRGVAFCLAVVAASLLAVSADARTAPEARITSTAGVVVGVVRDGIASFKGVPFAEPPVGDLRWAEPKPVKAWSGEKRADKYGDACIQKPGLSAENGGDPGKLSEDCLYLNIWTPQTGPKAKLPVIVWIHGGAFVFGAGGMPIYDGTPMASKGAVFVSINYRLGPLGFFAHPALDKAQPKGPNNFGLLDQIAALKWVRANIAAFGGDADNVTIMGQSAGGKSVMALYSSPLARGLFNRGVAMSVYIFPDVDSTKARQVGTAVAKGVGLDGANASLADLRRVPAEKFGDIADREAALGPVGIVGDDVLPESISDAFSAGREAKLPLIIGNTSNDVSVLSGFGFDPAAIVKQMGAAGRALGVLYPGVTGDEMARQAVRDIVFTMNTRWIADRHAKRAPTWRYYFDYVTEKLRPKNPNGVAHGAEITYFLDTAGIYDATAKKLTESDRMMAKRASDLLLGFARDGEPAAKGVPEWQSDRLLRDRALVIGPEKIEQRRNFMKVRLDVMKGMTKIAETVLIRP